MSTKPDWRTVNEPLMTHDRKRNDEPPTTEEILAYANGKLSPDDEERMRERLMNYPDLLRALAVPFPTEPAQPGDADYVSDEEWPEHWAALQKRMNGGRVVEFRRHAWTALAAVIAIVFAGLYWQAERKLGQPRIPAEEVVQLNVESRRGPGEIPAPVHIAGDSVILSVPVAEAHAKYRMVILDEDGTREKWRSDLLDAARIEVPKSFLAPGIYRIHVYGVDGARETMLVDTAVQIYPR